MRPAVVAPVAFAAGVLSATIFWAPRQDPQPPLSTSAPLRLSEAVVVDGRARLQRALRRLAGTGAAPDPAATAAAENIHPPPPPIRGAAGGTLAPAAGGAAGARREHPQTLTPAAAAELAAAAAALEGDESREARVARHFWGGCLGLRGAPVFRGADWEHHYRMMVAMTEKWWPQPLGHRPRHTGFGGWAGPWIETLWIERVHRMPPRDMAPFVPLLIPWTDLCAPVPFNPLCAPYREVFHVLKKRMIPTALYVTVVQNAQGLGVRMMLRHPNLFVLSAGGYGHAALPLLARPLDPLPPVPPHRRATLLFTGRLHTRLRRKVAERLRHTMGDNFGIFWDNVSAVNATTWPPPWVAEVENWAFVLCPRGFGRTSFHLGETLQLGRVPVYLHDGLPWLPYPRLRWDRLAVLASTKQLSELPALIAGFDVNASRRLALGLRHSHFSIAGSTDQALRFLRDPGASDMACVPLPNSTNGSPSQVEGEFDYVRLVPRDAIKVLDGAMPPGRFMQPPRKIKCGKPGLPACARR